MSAEHWINTMRAMLEAGARPCDCCDADAELVDHGDRLYVLDVRHDDDCPVLARHEGRTP